ncbi:hypothetical protein ACFC3P_12400 [Enterococcus thailandicus]|uniref:hypothetical protein n=1 Tax=Enterococcus thailandicus TaxID=417368 RepID=UPI0039A5B593
MAKAIEKHITFYDMHDEILKRIIDTEPTVKNYSEAIRFLCMNYESKEEKNELALKPQLNAIGKEISILTEIISEFADVQLKETGILIGSNSEVYQDAKNRVESKIKTNQTKKYSLKKKKAITNSVSNKEEPSQRFDPKNVLKR